MAAEILKAFTESQRGCRLAVYADLSVPMALISQSREPAHRETLQALCAEGRAVLTACDDDATDIPTPDAAVAFAADRLAIFLRAPVSPNDALCCLCDPDLDIDAFLPAARACLGRLTGAAE